ncbi:MAG: hypothetical protein E7075_06385 [Bacteroidales bacterium]|nr:hypothetical protein [Bacteroidales bacterium]
MRSISMLGMVVSGVGSRESDWRNQESGVGSPNGGIGSRESDVKVICLQGLQDGRYCDTQYQNGC